MIVLEELQKLYDKLLDFLKDLDACYKHSYAPEPEWEAELIGLFGTDATQAIALLDMIDFNGESEQHLLSYLPDVVRHLPTFGSKFLVIEHFKKLQEKFPNVKFGPAIFWSQMNAGYFDSALGRGKNSTDDGPPNKDVYLGGSL